MNHQANTDPAPTSKLEAVAQRNKASSVLDPVCGMTVDPVKTPHHATYSGATYHFCSTKCAATFKAEPAKYIVGPALAKSAATPIAAAGAIWTCPMHPEIRQPHAGTCPICGMALEPAAPSLDDKPNPELVDFTRRFWVSAVLAVPLLVFTMGSDLLGLHLLSPQVSPFA